MTYIPEPGDQLYLWPEMAPKNKTLAVLIQSRDRVEEFDKTVQTFYSTAKNRKNFDIIGVIDKDQIKMYSKVIDKYKKKYGMQFLHPEHHGTWKTLTKARTDFVRKTGYYFYWVMVDDIIGLKFGWDQAIVDKKDAFKDGIFTMVNDNEECHGRGAWMAAEKFYVVDDDPRWKGYNQEPVMRRDNGKDTGLYAPVKSSEHEHVLKFCDMLPISTKKWIELLNPFLDEGDYPSQHDSITAAIVRQLKVQYDEERCIRSGVYWEDLEDQGTTNSFADSKGDSKEASFRTLAQNNWKLLQPLVTKFKNNLKPPKYTIEWKK